MSELVFLLEEASAEEMLKGMAVQELERLTNYRYQKVSGSRDIGPHLDLNSNRSHSFSVFLAGIRRLVAALQGNME